MIRTTFQNMINNQIIINSPIELDTNEDPWEQYFPADGYHLQVSNPHNRLMFVKVEVLQVRIFEGKPNLLVLCDGDGNVVLDIDQCKPFDITISHELTLDDMHPTID